MNGPDSSHFPSPETLLTGLGASSPESFREHLFALHQALPYLPGPAQSALKAALLAHSPATPEHVDPWLESLYFLGGPEAELALEAFIKAHPDPVSSAVTCLTLLQNEHHLGTPGSASSPLDGIPTDTPDDTLDVLLPPHPVAPGFIATDCDGTTWDGDLGEALFAHVLKERLLNDDANPSLKKYLSDYGFQPATDVHHNGEQLLAAFESGALLQRGLDRGKTRSDVYLEYYLSNAWCLAGHSVASVKSLSAHLFEQDGGLHSRIFPGMLSLLQSARQRGYAVLAISASNQWSVEVGAAYLGIPPRHVRGITLQLADGILTPTPTPPLPFGSGKVDALRAFSPRAPRLSLGDSFERTDKEMLHYSDTAAVITPATPEEARRLSEVAPPTWLQITPATGAFSACATPARP